jgi:hypothetical protein
MSETTLPFEDEENFEQDLFEDEDVDIDYDDEDIE